MVLSVRSPGGVYIGLLLEGKNTGGGTPGGLPLILRYFRAFQYSGICSIALVLRPGTLILVNWNNLACRFPVLALSFPCTINSLLLLHLRTNGNEQGEL